jgi:hypothetical protein
VLLESRKIADDDPPANHPYWVRVNVCGGVARGAAELAASLPDTGAAVGKRRRKSGKIDYDVNIAVCKAQVAALNK